MGNSAACLKPSELQQNAMEFLPEKERNECFDLAIKIGEVALMHYGWVPHIFIAVMKKTKYVNTERLKIPIAVVLKHMKEAISCTELDEVVLSVFLEGARKLANRSIMLPQKRLNDSKIPTLKRRRFSLQLAPTIYVAKKARAPTGGAVHVGAAPDRPAYQK